MSLAHYDALMARAHDPIDTRDAQPAGRIPRDLLSRIMITLGLASEHSSPSAPLPRPTPANCTGSRELKRSAA